MSAEALSPHQFGMLPYSPDVEKSVGDRLQHERLQPRRIRLDQTFRPTQSYLSQERLDRYSPHVRQKDRPIVVHHAGEHVIWDGHNRIVAARGRGQKTMLVQYGNVDG